MSEENFDQASEEVTTEETTSETDEVTAEAESTEEVKASPGPGFRWFVVKTLTGQENKITRALKERIVNFNMTEYFDEILVPEETVVTMAGGRKRTIKKKFFPGYVLINMIMNDRTWHLVKDTDKITGFLGGTSDKPEPLSEEEVAYMTNTTQEGYKKPKSSIEFAEGDNVKVIEGPFASFVGVVEHTNDKGKVRVSVSIFGRPTPVELDYSQVEKVEE